MTHAADILGDSHWCSLISEALGSLWGDMVSQNVCLNAQWMRPEFYSTQKQRPRSASCYITNLVYKNFTYELVFHSAELSDGHSFRHTMSLSLRLPLEVWEEMEILSIAWSLHGCVHFTQNIGTEIFEPNKNLSQRFQKHPSITFTSLQQSYGNPFTFAIGKKYLPSLPP